MFVSAGTRPALRLSKRMFLSSLLVLLIAMLCFVAPFVLTQYLSDLYKYGKWNHARSFFSSSSSGSSSSGSSSSSTLFNYKAAVAYQAKDRNDPVYANIKVDSPTGEDNYFIGVNRIDDVYAGVADGVGGWAEHGFDSSAISRELCSAMRQFSQTTNVLKDNNFTPKELIELGYKKIKEEGSVTVGGTTAIVAHFPPNGLLKVANLGDSWCGVFRESKLIFQTEFQTVGFNAPYQLAVIPQKMLNDAAKRGGSYIQNKPSDADEYTFQLAKNDIVVLATDGVTDNIATEDMEIFLKDHADTQDLQATSEEFVSQVVKLSKNPHFPSVFAQEISKLTGKHYTGGKEDDITVVVVKVE